MNMHKKTLAEIADHYVKRYHVQKPVIEPVIAPDTGIIIVIPCFNEPALIRTLESLWMCEPAHCTVEVIIVINSGVNAGKSIRKQNSITFKQAKEWIKGHSKLTLRFNIICANEMPKKYAGVGLARKIGMDEALLRFGNIEKNGTIVCLDADCTVEKNYLRSIEREFEENDAKAAGLYFEHDIENEKDQHLIRGITNYELHLRYYVQALKYSGYPFAYHTIGSSMAVKADVYALSGGMNKRKAGEDFYFLHKVIPLGNFIEINSTCVYTSPRMSDRVPFGTGKAMLDWVRNEMQIYYTYNFETFKDLRKLIMSISELSSCDKKSKYEACVKQLPCSLESFLKQENFYDKLSEIINNSASPQTFRKRFFYWLDGFSVLKFIHFARDNFHNQIPVKEACKSLLDDLDVEFSDRTSEKEMLNIFRGIDRYG